MSYRFIDDDGREQSLDGAAAFGAAVRSGRVRRDTLVNVRGHWGRADGLPEFEAASDAPAPRPRPAAPPPKPAAEFWPIGAEAEEEASPPAHTGGVRTGGRETGPRAAPASETWQAGASYASPPLSPAATPAAASGGSPAAGDAEDGRLSAGARSALAALFIIVLAAFVEPGADLAYRLGYAASLVGIAWALAWLFLHWLRRGDIAVPVGAAVLATLFALPALTEQSQTRAGLDAQFDALDSSIDRVVNENAPAAPASAPAAGRSEAERIMWVTNQMLLDIEHMTDRMLVVYGASDTTAFEHFLTPEYVANAERYPAVGAFFTNYSRFVRGWSVEIVDSMESAVGRRLVEAGFGGATHERLRQDYQDGMLIGAAAQAALWDASLDLSTSGSELHEFLVSRSPFIFVDPADGMATFERDADFARYEQLATRYDAAVTGFAAAQGKWESDMRNKSDSMRALLSSAR